MKKYVEKLLEGQSIQSLHNGFVSKHADESLLHSYIATKLSILMSPESKQDALNTFLERKEPPLLSNHFFFAILTQHVYLTKTVYSILQKWSFTRTCPPILLSFLMLSLLLH